MVRHHALRGGVHGGRKRGEGKSQRQVAHRLALADAWMDGEGGGMMKDWIVNAVFGVVCTLAWFAMWELIHYLLTEV